jgi:hypothetical protein
MTYDGPIPNYTATLVNQSIIPSMFFGYTASVHYRRASASPTLEGYDSDRFAEFGHLPRDEC